MFEYIIISEKTGKITATKFRNPFCLLKAAFDTDTSVVVKVKDVIEKESITSITNLNEIFKYNLKKYIFISKNTLLNSYSLSIYYDATLRFFESISVKGIYNTFDIEVNFHNNILYISIEALSRIEQVKITVLISIPHNKYKYVTEVNETFEVFEKLFFKTLKEAECVDEVVPVAIKNVEKYIETFPDYAIKNVNKIIEEMQKIKKK